MTINSNTRFGPYTLAESIGVGGMGKGYRATDNNKSTFMNFRKPHRKLFQFYGA